MRGPPEASGYEFASRALRAAVSAVVSSSPRGLAMPSPRAAAEALRAPDEYIVVGHDDGIQAGAQGRGGNILVAARAIRVTGMHVKVADDLRHDDSGPLPA